MKSLGPDRPSVYYADETSLAIEGKAHILITALRFADPQQMIIEVVRLKEKCGIPLTQEIKWNQKELPAELRYKISDGILKIVSFSSNEALISIREGNDKQAAAEMMFNQIIDNCHAPYFVLHCDQHLCPDMERLWSRVYREDSPTCVTLQEVNSSRDQLMQCVDIFAGLYRTAIRHELEGIQKMRKTLIEDGWDEEPATVSWYVKTFTRGIIPGTIVDERSVDDMQVKRTWGKGFRVESSISQEALNMLRENLGHVYMGCLH